MSSSSSKMDMSLDQIIKLQKNGGRRSNNKSSYRGGGGGGKSGNLAFKQPNSGIAARKAKAAAMARGRGARMAATATSSTTLRGKRLGVNAGFKTRRAFNTPNGRRLAQNLVKRAMIQSRRQAIARRREAFNLGDISSNEGAGMMTRTQRLVSAVRKWKNTAHVLQNVLQNQQRSPIRNRPRGGNRVQIQRGGRGIRRSLQNRLGWRQNDLTNAFAQSLSVKPQRFRRMQRGGYNASVVNNGGSGGGRLTYGQMQSDLISREQARQARLVAELLNQSIAPPNRPRGRGGRRRISIAAPVVFNRGARKFRRGGRGGFGGDRFSSDLGFNNQQLSRSVTLNERFGGNRGGGGGRGPKFFRGGRSGGFNNGRGRGRYYNNNNQRFIF